MGQTTPGKAPLSYVGVKETNPPQLTFAKDAPSQYNFKNFTDGDIWVDQTDERAHMLIKKDSSSGTWIDMTNRSSKSAFSAYAEHTQVGKTGDGTIYYPVIDHVEYDQNGDYNPATSIFTAPVTGIYLFSAAVGFIGITPAHTEAVGQLKVSTGTPPTIYKVLFDLNPAGIAPPPALVLSNTIMIRVLAGSEVSMRTSVANGTKTIDIHVEDTRFSGILLN